MNRALIAFVSLTLSQVKVRCHFEGAFAERDLRKLTHSQRVSRKAKVTQLFLTLSMLFFALSTEAMAGDYIGLDKFVAEISKDDFRAKLKESDRYFDQKVKEFISIIQDSSAPSLGNFYEIRKPSDGNLKLISRAGEAFAQITAEVFRMRREDPNRRELRAFDGLEAGWRLEILNEAFRKLDTSLGQQNRPSGLERSFARALSKAMADREPSQGNACEAVCATFENMSEWSHDESGPPKLRDSEELVNTGSWNTPILAIEALFATEAAPLCPKVANRTEILSRALTRWAQAMQTFEDIPPGKFRGYATHFSVLLLSRLKEYPARYPELAKVIPEISSSKAKSSTELLAQMLDRQGKLLRAWTSHESGLGGSGLDVHSLMTMLSSYGAGGQSAEAKEILRDVVTAVEANNPAPKGEQAWIKYLAQQSKAISDTMSPRGTSARAVPYAFAKYSVNGYRREDLQLLLDSLELYADFSGHLLFHVPRDGAHMYNFDLIAPYYFSPTTYLATTAATLAVAATSGEQKERAARLLDRVNGISLASYRGNGKWTHSSDDGTSLFGRAARSYNSALPALSLVPACRGDGSVGAYSSVIPSDVQFPGKSYPLHNHSGKRRQH
jgi:hypothetical protein